MPAGGFVPSIEENLARWTTYDWSRHDEEWSEVWGTSSAIWHASLLPRVEPFLGSAQTILEIAPGYGRFTRFLKDYCRRLVLVDLTARCIEACRARFAEQPHIEYHVNDGLTLPAVSDRSIDFAFTFDSLVHAEGDVIQSYLGELARVLSPDGVAFLHHSNLGAFQDPATGKLSIENKHWRATSVSAAMVSGWSARYDLACPIQEIVNWGVPELTDCFSIVTPRGSRWDREPRCVENPRFMDEALRIGGIVELYSFR
jgi:SAM-dependent methyltransferase